MFADFKANYGGHQTQMDLEIDEGHNDAPAEEEDPEHSHEK